MEKSDGLYNADNKGARYCIGQGLVKLILAMTLRKCVVVIAYDRMPRKRSPTTVDGDKAYKMLAGAAHPSGGFVRSQRAYEDYIVTTASNIMLAHK